MIHFHDWLQPLMEPKGVLSPHPDNPNNGDVDELIGSILRNGCYRPVYANKNTGLIVAGHTLYQALLHLGAENIPVGWMEQDKLGEMRVLLADNQIANLGRIDDTALLKALEYLNANDDSGLIGSGFSERELENLRRLALDDTPLHINLGGKENLIHTITCPECGHEWVRGQSPTDL